MKVIYMGTPDFAVPCLKRLVKENYDVVCVVTQPDKPVGRKQMLTPSDVKVTAQVLGLNVYQPQTLRSDEAYEYLAAFRPDYIVVAAYGKILPQRILDIPKYACINVHGSLLPKYRGAAPIQRSVLNGDKVTGVTTMLMNAGLDTGDILLTRSVDIDENETSGELFDRLARLSPDLLIETLKKYTVGAIRPIPQDESHATYAAMLSKAEAEIDFTKTAEDAHNLIRGMSPWPVAFTVRDGKKLKILESRRTEINRSGEPGDMFTNGSRLYAVFADGCLEFVSVQPEGKKPMSGNAYAIGHGIRDL